MIRATDTTDIFELVEWCQEYRKSPRCNTIDPMRRFAIGFYQIYQGMKWRGTASEDESFAAAFMNFLMVIDLLDLHIEESMKGDLLNWGLSNIRCYSLNFHEDLLYTLSHAQQMLVYYSDRTGIKRRDRYDKNILTTELVIAIGILIDRIPKNKRAEAIFNATSVLTGEL